MAAPPPPPMPLLHTRRSIQKDLSQDTPLPTQTQPHAPQSILPPFQSHLIRICTEELERHGILELPDVSPYLLHMVRTLNSVQKHIGQRGRLHFFLELAETTQESRRKCFYGHSDIITLFSPTVHVAVGHADLYAMHFC